MKPCDTGVLQVVDEGEPKGRIAGAVSDTNR